MRGKVLCVTPPRILSDEDKTTDLGKDLPLLGAFPMLCASAAVGMLPRSSKLCVPSWFEGPTNLMMKIVQCQDLSLQRLDLASHAKPIQPANLAGYVLKSHRFGFFLGEKGDFCTAPTCW